MNRENEKRVVEEICAMSINTDYSDFEDLENILSIVNRKTYFKESIFGKRYIERLNNLQSGVTFTDCVLCGNDALNQVICTTCIQKVSDLRRRRSEATVLVTPTYVESATTPAPQQNVVEAPTEDVATMNNTQQPVEQPAVDTHSVVPKDISKDISEDISIEELFKDMDDSLLQLASQSTAKSIKRLTWINIGLSVVNLIMIFFLTLFLWQFITSM